MNKVKIAALAATALACLSLEGCGGADSGGGGVQSTPTPPPPAGANANLLGSLKSETFVNDATQGALTVANGAGSVAAGATTASFVYNAASQTYTMTVGGHSQSFGPSNIDPSLTNSQITTYIIKSGNTTDSLTLTKPGTSGHFTYEYVGAAFWQNTNLASTSSGNGSLYAVAYGEPTPASGVPTSGTATYGIDMLGAQTTGTTVSGISGTGSLLVNFSTGALALGGSLTSGGGFSGGGTLSSSGSFSGAFNLSTTYADGSGQMSGRLYGPAGQEIGGSFYTANDGTNVAAGVFLGRTGAAGATDTSFASQTGAELLNADLVVQNGKTNGQLGTAALGLVNQGMPSIVFIGPGSSWAMSYAYWPVTYPHPLAVTNALASANGQGVILTDTAANQYVRAGVYFDKTGASPVYDQFTFGFETPASAVPRTGYAAYDTFIDGILVPSGTTASPTEVVGSGTVGINLASGAVTTAATLQDVGSSLTNLGTLAGTGTLSSAANSFSGTLTVAGATNYSGNWQGRLYGPAATEIGAVFNGAGADGSSLTGTMTGVFNPAILDPAATLATLTRPATFAANESIYSNVPYTFPGYTQLAFRGVTQITYDPVNQTYTIGSTGLKFNADGLPLLTGTVTAADVVPAQSDATFTAYATPAMTGRILNSGPSNPTIQLSYLSFAEMAQTVSQGGSNPSYTVDHFELFGIPTAQSSMPTSGSATYSGVVYGRGNVYAFGTGDFVLGGAGQLSANFASGALTSTLTLNATPVGGGTTQAVGSIDYSGTITGTSFGANATAGTGQMAGGFYGPGAAEAGAAFSYEGRTYAQPLSVNVAGVFVGKKN